MKKRYWFALVLFVGTTVRPFYLFFLIDGPLVLSHLGESAVSSPAPVTPPLTMIPERVDEEFVIDTQGHAPATVPLIRRFLLGEGREAEWLLATDERTPTRQELYVVTSKPERVVRITITNVRHIPAIPPVYRVLARAP